MKFLPVARTAHSLSRSLAAALLIGLAVGVTPTTVGAANRYPVGVPNPSEPSGMAPPLIGALPGYSLDYISDFNGSGLPKGWYKFQGIPGGDPSGQFSARHVLVNGGLLRLKTYQDPQFAGHWVTGGVCQCGHPSTYGAYFVRSRLTGAGPNSVELLWPRDNTWPPEIDFNETLSHSNLTTATVHWTDKTNFYIMRIDMTRWHTWGVVWTPHYVLDLVDGHPWHEFAITNKSLDVPMRLDFEQRTSCPSTTRCPSVASSMLIDWVVEYRPS